MDNLDLIFLGFYCHVQLGLRAVQCEVLDSNVPFKFSLCQSEWQHADPGIRFSALLGISKIPPLLELPFGFFCWCVLFFFSCTLLCFPGLDLYMDSQVALSAC